VVPVVPLVPVSVVPDVPELVSDAIVFTPFWICARSAEAVALSIVPLCNSLWICDTALEALDRADFAVEFALPAEDPVPLFKDAIDGEDAAAFVAAAIVSGP
jgi:hypothetical protein